MNNNQRLFFYGLKAKLWIFAGTVTKEDLQKLLDTINAVLGKDTREKLLNSLDVG